MVNGVFQRVRESTPVSEERVEKFSAVGFSLRR
jgi:hypothetical protein